METASGHGPRYYLEDFPVGREIALPVTPVDDEEMRAFARRFDPQAVHLDDDHARGLGFPAAVASGWFTASLFMRMQCDAFLTESAGIVSPGVEGLRWLRPVCGGDTLGGWVRVTGNRRSRSKPDRGIVEAAVSVHNQRDEDVLSLTTVSLLYCRPGPQPTADG